MKMDAVNPPREPNSLDSSFSKFLFVVEDQIDITEDSRKKGSSLSWIVVVTFWKNQHGVYVPMVGQLTVNQWPLRTVGSIPTDSTNLIWI